MGVHYLRHHLFRIGHHTPTDPHADRVGPFRQSATIYGRNDKGTITCECYDHLQSCVNDNLMCFVCSWQESSELTEYQACRRKLIRTSIFFALLFLILKSPANFIFFISRMPPNVFPQVVSDWASDWKIFAYRVGMLNSSIYPVVIFLVSNEMKFYCCGKFRCCLGSADVA